MRRACLLLLVAVTLAAGGAGAADRFAPLWQRFDPGGMTAAELRLLQGALAFRGHLAGPLDGAWSPEAQHALAAYAAEEFGGEIPANVHAAALVIALLAELDAEAWDAAHLPELGLSLALPYARLAPAPDEAPNRRWTGRDGDLLIVAERQSDAEARALHAAGAAIGGVAGTAAAGSAAIAGPGADGRRRLVTSGTLGDGRAFHLHSDADAAGWRTVSLLAAPAERARLALVAASIRQGPPEPWVLPADGRLAGIARLAATLVAAVAETDAPRLLPGAPGRAAALPGAPRAGAPPPPAPGAATSSGSGFFVAPRILVTAGHVVAGCTAIALPDGTRLGLAGLDLGLDLAVLLAGRESADWLTLAPAPPGPRLGQRVFAVGYPYFAITGTALHVTGGNVSALVGLGDDRRFFALSAPVQPGNSGGPLVDDSGTVLGVVLARLSETYIAEATGSLPQNLNFAVGPAELAAFLGRAGLASAPGGIAGFAMDDGAPAGIADAVVPVLCH